MKLNLIRLQSFETYSPTHESFIELGKSAWIGTLSDLRLKADGNLVYCYLWYKR